MSKKRKKQLWPPCSCPYWTWLRYSKWKVLSGFATVSTTKKKSANTKNKMKIMVLARQDMQSRFQHRKESIYKTFLIKLTAHFNRNSSKGEKKGNHELTRTLTLSGSSYPSSGNHIILQNFAKFVRKLKRKYERNQRLG